MAALAALGITEVAAVVGGSMGGARALEWLVGHPDSVRAGLVLAVGARATADQIGTQSTQIAAIKADPDWQGGDYYDTGRAPDAGLQIARRFAHLTYRGEVELDTRFGNDAQGDEDPLDGGRYAVQSYLEHQGEKLVARFDAGSYVILTEALSSHDVGRGRGGVEAALRACPVPVVVGGITSDRLYPLRLQEELAELLPGCDGLNVVESIYGHDGFLVETEAVGELIRQTLELAAPVTGPRTVHCRSAQRPPPTSAADRRIRRRPSTGCCPRRPRRARPRRGHRQADHPAGRTRPGRGGGRPDRRDARGAQHVAAGHPRAAGYRRGDPAAPTTASTPCWWPRRGTGSTRRARSPRWRACCGPAGGSGWCGTPATSGWAGSRIWAASSATRTTRSASTVTLPPPFADVRAPPGGVDELPDAAGAYRPGGIAQLLHHLAGRGAHPDAGQVRELLATHPALANAAGLALPYVTVCVRATLT